MNHDDERDYAEECANLADMRREQESEAAHERLADRVATALRTLSTEAHDDARASIERLVDEVEHRLPPNAHRYELLARYQHTAHLASQAAAAIEYAGYDLPGAATGTVEAYLATHGPANPAYLLGRALRDAGVRVLDTVRDALDADEQADTDARERADLDATEAHLRRVTR